MTPLRQRLIDELTLRGYAARTIDSYVAVVARLARFYRARARSVDGRAAAVVPAASDDDDGAGERHAGIVGAPLLL